MFSDKTSDMLFLYNIPQPPFVTNQAYANAANATNKGVEVSLGGDVIAQDNFKWNARVNIGAVRNRITNSGGSIQRIRFKCHKYPLWICTQADPFNMSHVSELKEGYPAGVFWLPQHAGFDANGKELFVTYDSEGKVMGTNTTFTEQGSQIYRSHT